MEPLSFKPLISRCASALAVLVLPSVLSIASPPPGASTRVSVIVPSSLKSGDFAEDRFLNVPPGFKIALFARVPGSRFLTAAPNGDVFVSSQSTGRITILRPDPNGGVHQSFTWASGLASPQGMVFHTIGATTYLYVSESSRISRYPYNSGETASHDRQVLLSGLPDSGAHPLKNIALDSDHNLYVAIASSCNVCASDASANPVRGSVYIYNADGTNGRLFARGLRNAEGLAFLPGTNNLWVTVNSRDDVPYPFQDNTGNYGHVVPAYRDDHPPDLFTAVHANGNYGWPFCNSNPDAGVDNMPLDPDLDTNSDAHIACGTLDHASKGIQAHSAALGLAMLGDTNFAPLYRSGAVVALHGSWDRSRRTGYKVIYFPFDASGQPGPQVDLVTGWLDDASQGVWGRPVGVAADAGGGLLIADDGLGAIYRLSTSDPIVVSAASGAPAISAGSLASIYGSGFPANPQVVVRDDQGDHAASVTYAAAGQINFLVPKVSGAVTILVNGKSAGTGFVGPVAPALFSMNGNGSGVAAATAVRVVLPTNISSPVPVFTCSDGTCTAVPIDPGIDAPVYISLYGTGITPPSGDASVRVTIGGVDATVLYAGPQTQYPGLDQVNVLLPLELHGRGLVDVIVYENGMQSNAVQLSIK